MVWGLVVSCTSLFFCFLSFTYLPNGGYEFEVQGFVILNYGEILIFVNVW